MAAQPYYNTSYPATHLLISYDPPVCTDALERHRKPLFTVHCRAKLSLQQPPESREQTRKHTDTHLHQPVYPLWFSATGEIWWDSAKVYMLSRGITMQFSLQRAKKQPNPAWDYNILLNFSSSFPCTLTGLSLPLHPSVFTFLPFALSSTLLSLSTSSFLLILHPWFFWH